MTRALLVDDEPEICELLCVMLARIGAQCERAHSLEEGRNALLTAEYDAVFLDVHLPDGLGYDLIPEIRRTNPKANVFAISALDQEKDRAAQAGADLFIPKPFNRSAILASVKELGFRI